MQMRLLVFYLLFIPFLVPAQVLNIDREKLEDSAVKKWEFVIGASLSSDKQKRNLFESSTNFEFVRMFPSHYFIAGMVRNDLEYNGPTQIQNEGLVHLRYRDRDSRKVSPEIFAHSMWNGQWGLLHRFSLGANYRIRMLEKNGLDLYTGFGLFHEWDSWNWTGVRESLQPPVLRNVNIARWRLNHYLKLSARTSDWVDFSVISYLQPGFENASILSRWYIDANTYFKAGEKFSLLLHWDHILDSKPAVPIDHFFYGFSVGLQYGRAW